MIPFVLRFEKRRPGAGELTILAVLCAAAVAARAAFAWIPHFKPMTAVIMLAGIAFGPETGFLTGAISALVSNFFFGQGPWTPWQMFAFGTAGAISGLVIPRCLPAKRIPMGIFGGILVVILIGPILDTSTLFMTQTTLEGAAPYVVYLSGLPVNVIHGAATAVTLFFLGEPVLERLDRVKKKYGLMGGRR